MAKKQKHEAVATEAQVTTEQPVTTEPAVAAEPKKKAPRYAPRNVLDNPAAVITYLAPQYHRDPASLTYRKYALFELGMSVAQIEAKFVENNWPRMKARNQLRWEIEHGKVVLGLPE